MPEENLDREQNADLDYEEASTQSESEQQFYHTKLPKIKRVLRKHEAILPTEFDRDLHLSTFFQTKADAVDSLLFHQETFALRIRLKVKSQDDTRKSVIIHEISDIPYLKEGSLTMDLHRSSFNRQEARLALLRIHQIISGEK